MLHYICLLIVIFFASDLIFEVKISSKMLDNAESSENDSLSMEFLSEFISAQLLNVDDIQGLINECNAVKEPCKISLPCQNVEHPDLYMRQSPKRHTIVEIPEDVYQNDNEVSPKPTRFAAIAIAAVVIFIQTFTQSLLGALCEPALVAFPQWSRISLSQLSVWGSICTAVFIFPACMAINKYGLKWSLFGSCLFYTVGSAVRCLPIICTSMPCLHVSGGLLSMGSVITSPLIMTLSAQWFPANERNLATGVSSAISTLGSAAVYLIGPWLVYSENEPLDSSLMKMRIMRMLYTCLILNIVATMLVVAAFPKQVQSHVSKASLASHKDAKVCGSLKVLFGSSKMWTLLLAFTLTNTLSVPWFSRLTSLFHKYELPFDFTATNSLAVILHTFILCLVFSTFANKTPEERKVHALCCRFISSLSFYWLMVMLKSNKLKASRLAMAIFVAFPYGWCSNSIIYQMGVDHFPMIPEGFVAGYMTLMNNLFMDVTYLVLYLFEDLDYYWIHVGLVVCSFMSCICLMFTKDNKTNEDYKMLNV